MLHALLEFSVHTAENTLELSDAPVASSGAALLALANPKSTLLRTFSRTLQTIKCLDIHECPDVRQHPLCQVLGGCTGGCSLSRRAALRPATSLVLLSWHALGVRAWYCSEIAVCCPIPLALTPDPAAHCLHWAHCAAKCLAAHASVSHVANLCTYPSAIPAPHCSATPTSATCHPPKAWRRWPLPSCATRPPCSRQGAV